MPTIPIVNSRKKATVSSEDYSRIMKVSDKWYLHDDGYAQGFRKGADGHWKKVFMHHLIKGVPGGGKVVDHKNHNPLDNRRSNLRVVNKSVNAKNAVKK